MARFLRSYTFAMDTLDKVRMLRWEVEKRPDILDKLPQQPVQIPKRLARMELYDLNEEHLRSKDMDEVAFQCDLREWKPEYGSTDNMIDTMERNNPREARHCAFIREWRDRRKTVNLKNNEVVSRAFAAEAERNKSRPVSVLTNESRFIEAVLLMGVQAVEELRSNVKVGDDASTQTAAVGNSGAGPRRDGTQTINQPVKSQPRKKAPATTLNRRAG